MAEVVPKVFVLRKYESFTRQLNGWGFNRLHQSGNDFNAYYHECFLRGLPHLVVNMKRQTPGQGKLLPHVEGEPNFYQIDRAYPLPPSAPAPGPPPAWGTNGGPPPAEPRSWPGAYPPPRPPPCAGSYPGEPGGPTQGYPPQPPFYAPHYGPLIGYYLPPPGPPGGYPGGPPSGQPGGYPGGSPSGPPGGYPGGPPSDQPGGYPRGLPSGPPGVPCGCYPPPPGPDGDPRAYRDEVGQWYPAGEIYRPDLLPVPSYVLRCVRAHRVAGPAALANLLDASFLGDGETSLRAQLRQELGCAPPGGDDSPWTEAERQELRSALGLDST